MVPLFLLPLGGPVVGARLLTSCNLSCCSVARQAQGQTARTKVYGIVGNPVSHSKSPLIHNAAFQSPGTGSGPVDAVYVPLLVDDMRRFMGVYGSSAWPDFCGFSVTIPHKVGGGGARPQWGACSDRPQHVMDIKLHSLVLFSSADFIVMASCPARLAAVSIRPSVQRKVGQQSRCLSADLP
jgi:hypothetical protein